MVHYTTDPSPDEGIKFKHTSGIAVFGPDETMVTVPVTIINDEIYEPTEFSMSLSAPEKCETGLYLHKCRVKIIEDDTFPSNKYKAEISSDPRSAPGLGLMLEYAKFNFNSNVVMKASMKVVLSDVVDNVFFIWSLFLGKYLVLSDVVDNVFFI